ncbi:MAG: LysR family transcriptional regulator [Alphaproteobacteria bacterium]|nr:LysR family transcriptional regulator [Alphaproteobacteria bacterium]
MSEDLPETAQLEAFLAVASTLHFGRAGEQLHVTQSTVSHRIRGLEERLGVQLFDRSRRQIRLSAAGAAYLRRVQGLLGELRRARAHALGADRGGQGRLRIGYSGAITASPLLEPLGQLGDVEVELQRRGLADQLQALVEGQLDIGSSFLPVPERADLQTWSLPERPLFAWMAPGHPLAGRGGLSASELAEVRLILLSEHAESGFAPFLAQRGLGVRGPAFLVDALDATLELARRGLGVALLPELTTPPPGLVARPVDLPPARIQVIVSAARQQEPLIQRYLRALPALRPGPPSR